MTWRFSSVGIQTIMVEVSGRHSEVGQLSILHLKHCRTNEESKMYPKQHHMLLRNRSNTYYKGVCVEASLMKYVGLDVLKSMKENPGTSMGFRWIRSSTVAYGLLTIIAKGLP